MSPKFITSTGNNFWEFSGIFLGKLLPVLLREKLPLLPQLDLYKLEPDLMSWLKPCLTLSFTKGKLAPKLSMVAEPAL